MITGKQTQKRPLPLKARRAPDLSTPFVLNKNQLDFDPPPALSLATERVFDYLPARQKQLRLGPSVEALESHAEQRDGLTLDFHLNIDPNRFVDAANATLSFDVALTAPGFAGATEQERIDNRCNPWLRWALKPEQTWTSAMVEYRLQHKSGKTLEKHTNADTLRTAADMRLKTERSQAWRDTVGALAGYYRDNGSAGVNVSNIQSDTQYWMVEAVHLYTSDDEFWHGWDPLPAPQTGWSLTEAPQNPQPQIDGWVLEKQAAGTNIVYIQNPHDSSKDGFFTVDVVPLAAGFVQYTLHRASIPVAPTGLMLVSVRYGDVRGGTVYVYDQPVDDWQFYKEGVNMAWKQIRFPTERLPLDYENNPQRVIMPLSTFSDLFATTSHRLLPGALLSGANMRIVFSHDVVSFLAPQLEVASELPFFKLNIQPFDFSLTFSNIRLNLDTMVFARHLTNRLNKQSVLHGLQLAFKTSSAYVRDITSEHQRHIQDYIHNTSAASIFRVCSTITRPRVSQIVPVGAPPQGRDPAHTWLTRKSPLTAASHSYLSRYAIQVGYTKMPAQPLAGTSQNQWLNTVAAREMNAYKVSGSDARDVAHLLSISTSRGRGMPGNGLATEPHRPVMFQGNVHLENAGLNEHSTLETHVFFDRILTIHGDSVTIID